MSNDPKFVFESLKSEDIGNFIFDLTPGDVGTDIVDGKMIKYEGFTDQCWEGALEDNKSVEDLENEIMNQWDAEAAKEGYTVREEIVWSSEPEPFEDNIIYAIYSTQA